MTEQSLEGSFYSNSYGDTQLELSLDELILAAERNGVGFEIEQDDEGNRFMSLDPEAVSRYVQGSNTRLRTRIVDGREIVEVWTRFVPVINRLLGPREGTVE